jgi:hypothetical protein
MVLVGLEMAEPAWELSVLTRAVNPQQETLNNDHRL